MAGLTRLAWRNLGRNRRRTLITATALALGTALSVGTYGLMDGMLVSMLDTLTRYDLGHLQAHRKGYLGEPTLDRTLPGTGAIARRMRADPQVVGVAPRVLGFALASKASRSRGVQIVGVDPRRERNVTSLQERIKKGRYLSDEATPWPLGRALNADERREDEALTQRAKAKVTDELDALESLDDDDTKGGKGGKGTKGARGTKSNSPVEPSKPVKALADASDLAALSPSSKSALSAASIRAQTLALARRLSPPPKRPPEVIIGKTLAKTLRATVGSELYLVGQAVDGASADLRVKVRGIFETGTETYDRRVYIHLVDLQHLLHLGRRIHEIAARLAAHADARRVAKRLRGHAAAGVAIQSWDEIRPDMKQMIDLSRASSMLMVFIILFVAVLGVINTMLMSVFERTRELGILKAIGMSGFRVLSLIVVETLLLALVAAMVGTILGLGLDLILMHVGINLTGLTETSMAGVALDPVLRAAITAEGLFVPAIVLLVSCLLASIYPALRAARLRPAIGMREL